MRASQGAMVAGSAAAASDPRSSGPAAGSGGSGSGSREKFEQHQGTGAVDRPGLRPEVFVVRGEVTIVAVDELGPPLPERDQPTVVVIDRVGVGQRGGCVDGGRIRVDREPRCPGAEPRVGLASHCMGVRALSRPVCRDWNSNSSAGTRPVAPVVATGPCPRRRRNRRGSGTGSWSCRSRRPGRGRACPLASAVSVASAFADGIAPRLGCRRRNARRRAGCRGCDRKTGAPAVRRRWRGRWLAKMAFSSGRVRPSCASLSRSIRTMSKWKHVEARRGGRRSTAAPGRTPRRRPRRPSPRPWARGPRGACSAGTRAARGPLA